MSQRSCKVLRGATIAGRRYIAGESVSLDDRMARILVGSGVVESPGLVSERSGNRGAMRGGRRAETRG